MPNRCHYKTPHRPLVSLCLADSGWLTDTCLLQLLPHTSPHDEHGQHDEHGRSGFVGVLDLRVCSKITWDALGQLADAHVLDNIKV